MSQRGLEALLRPKSIAVIGASDKVGRAGTTMMKNLLSGGFNGPVFPVNPTRNSVSGVFTYPSIDKLPQVQTWQLSVLIIAAILNFLSN